ncbi:MAG: ABC transporter ATP-binding protein [Lachnospiraceae bacterium]|nr:ABC transporter ATP-binding protein [Lachnospiraceae bacterium]MDY5742576.1 ABC transporter ATP-binding protein [Lachnospiraceae bacterium]
MSKSVKRLLQYFAPYRFRLLAVLVSILISSLSMVLLSVSLKTLIDVYITPLLLQETPDFGGLKTYLLQLAVIFVIGIFAAWLYGRIMAVVAHSIMRRLRFELFSHMQSLPLRYFDSHPHGDIMSHYTNDVDALRQMLSQSVPQVLSAIVTMLAIFVAMLSLSVWLTLVMAVMLVMVFSAFRYISGRSGSYFVKQQAAIADVNGYVEEMIEGLRVVKVFCREQESADEFMRRNLHLTEQARSANTYVNMMAPVLNNMGYIIYVVIALIGSVLAIGGSPNLSLTGMGVISLGMIASFLQLSRAFMQPIQNISQQMASIVQAMAGAGRIFRLLDETSESDDGYVTLVNACEQDGEMVETDEHTGFWAWKHPHKDGSLTYTRLRGEVVLENVDFGYVEDKTVLHQISLYANEGQKIAFVGSTGAGKTTITNLINRFYDITEGKIRYDGININKIKKSDLRRSLGVVLQDVNLFTGSVMDNIRYGNLNATDEECIRAAKLANADGFIRMLPEGYMTILEGDGSGLSQGQRQLISIARAAVADPPLMILDEATSSIDTRTEAIVQKGMDALMKNRTVFVIAHRLSTIKNADVIMVLEQGRIIERGDHQSLLAKRGKYYQLYTGAFEME